MTTPTVPNRANRYGTDVEIFREPNGPVRADARTGLTGIAHSLLRLQGFARNRDGQRPNSYEILDRLPEQELRRRVSVAAEDLARHGYTVNVDPDLYTDTALPPQAAEARRQQAATRTSPATDHSPPPPRHLPPPAPTTVRRTR